MNTQMFAPNLPWNGISQNIALLASIFFFSWICQKENMSLRWKQGVWFFSFFFLAAFCGGRLFSIFDIASANSTPPDWTIFFTRASKGSLRWYGSMLFLLSFSPLFVRLLKPQFRWKYFDLFAMAICIYIVFVKQGCQLAGDGCYGIPTTLPWGMYYANGLIPSLLPVHPTPIYDSLFHLLLLLFLMRWRDQATFKGQTALLFFGLSSAFCFSLEFLRRNPDVALGLTLAQWTYLLIIGITVGIWLGVVGKSP